MIRTMMRMTYSFHNLISQTSHFTMFYKKQSYVSIKYKQFRKILLHFIFKFFSEVFSSLLSSL